MSKPGSPRIRGHKHVFLMGLMGAGKSTVGPMLARALGRDFVDLDRALETAAGGRKISEIFAAEGEAGFRARETACLREVCARDGLVVALGGGAVLADENRRLLRENGATVYLRARVSTLARRLGPELAARPLLADAVEVGDVVTRLERLRQAREPLYTAADLILDTDLEHETNDVPGISARIIEKLQALEHARDRDSAKGGDTP